MNGGQFSYHPSESGGPPGATGENKTTLEIDPQYKRMYLLDKKKGSISLFTCPIEGCDWQTDQGPGALRMHIVIKADPKCTGRFCKEHAEYVAAHPETQKQDWVRYLAQFPSALHGEQEIGHIKE